MTVDGIRQIAVTALLVLSAVGSRAQYARHRARRESTDQPSAAWTDSRRAEMASNVRAEVSARLAGLSAICLGTRRTSATQQGLPRLVRHFFVHDSRRCTRHAHPVGPYRARPTKPVNSSRRDLSFDQDIYVKNFEITIRMLGGLLSSYQLTGDKRLLALAEDLGKRLLPAFNSPTGMPYVYVNLKTGAVRGVETNPAEAGTLLLEFGTLSKLTGKPVYYEKQSGHWSRFTTGDRPSDSSAAASTSKPANGPTPIHTSAAASTPITSTCSRRGACSATKTACACGR